jgi:hypothetical protein
MKKIVHIILNPYYETATYVWGDAFFKYYKAVLEKRASDYDDYLFIHLFKEDAVWSKLVYVLRQYKDEFCVDDGVAHGASNLKVGYNNTLLHAVDDETAEIAPLIGLFKQTSCLVGKQLCPFLYQKGTKWTIGNTQPMYLVGGPDDEVKSFLLPEIESVLWLHERFHDGHETNATMFYNYMLQLYDNEIARWQGTSVAYYLNINKTYRQLWDSGFILKKEKPSPPPPQPPKKKYRVVLKVEKDLTGYASIGRLRVPIYIYALGTNIAGEAVEEEEQQE